MPIYTTVEQVEVGFSSPQVTVNPLASCWSRQGWALGKLVATGILLMYLVGWVHDFQRISRLEAEPAPASKIITISKYEAWDRIYSRPVKWITRPAAAPANEAP